MLAAADSPNVLRDSGQSPCGTSHAKRPSVVTPAERLYQSVLWSYVFPYITVQVCKRKFRSCVVFFQTLFRVAACALIKGLAWERLYEKQFTNSFQRFCTLSLYLPCAPIISLALSEIIMVFLIKTNSEPIPGKNQWWCKRRIIIELKHNCRLTSGYNTVNKH